MKKITLTILFCTVLTTILWILSIPSLPRTSQAPLRLASQIIANLTILFMAFSMILSMKLHILDKQLSGLTISYKVHAFIGSLAFLVMIAHPLLLVINALPNVHTAFSYVFFGTRTAANFGIAAVYTTIFAFTFMTFLKIPYQHWLTTHRLLGISFLLGSIHAFLAPSNLLRFPPLTIWMSMWILLGVSASFYSAFLYKLLGHHLKHTITQLEHIGDVLNVTLTPTQKSLEYLPGQFIYARFNNKQINNELHPFSLASTPHEHPIRLSIKKLGDYTKKIQDVLQTNDTVDIYGPFGNFGEAYIHPTTDMIWVAGGVGITPFLSMMRAEYIQPTDKKILFYYSLNKPEEAIFHPEIQGLNEKLPNVSYVKWIAQETGFLTMEIIIKKWKELGNTTQPKILVCGPPMMMKALQSQAKALNIPASTIIVEEFNFF